MSRRPQSTPTEVELEILQVLWDLGPSTVRQVVDALNQHRTRAYTSILSMMNVMLEKKLVTREEQGRAHVYRAVARQEKMLGTMVKDLLGRAFDGSASSLITHVLDQSSPNESELKEIQRLLNDYKGKSP